MNLLPGEVGLNFAHVEQLSRELEGEGQVLLETRAILLQLLCVSHLEVLDLGLVLLLGLGEHVVPVRVEFLVLLDVCLLDLFLALLV